ncbi:MAG: DUF2752 domain-containing protein, partial [Acidobacteriota bacterium]
TFPLHALVVACSLMVIEFAKQRLQIVAIWFALGVGGIYLYVFDPGHTGFFPVCPFRALTGFTCPGCGSTRGMHQLLHGNLLAAFELNPLLILSLPLLLYILLHYTRGAILKRPVRPNALAPKYIYTLFGIVLFFWVFRNTPLYPFAT